MGIFITWLALSIIIGFIGSSRRVGFFGGFLWSILLSPIIGLIIVLISESNSKIKERRYTRKLLEEQNNLIKEQTNALNKINNPDYLTEDEKDRVSKEQIISEFKEKYGRGEITLNELHIIEDNLRGVYKP